MFNSLFGKLVTVLLLFGLLMSLIFGMIVRYSHHLYHQEAQQQFHADIASRFAVLAGWTPSGWVNPNMMETAFAKLVTANPRFHVFILDQSGVVLAHYPSSLKLASNLVAMEPIRRFLQHNPPLPILGDDPTITRSQQIFSAAPLHGKTRPDRFLYVTLDGLDDDIGLDGLRLSYVTREGAWLIFACLMLALTGGLLSLKFIVRPVKQLALIMDAFHEDHFKGDLAAGKKPPASSDDIESLNTTFYRMAERMQVQMREIEQADSRRREFIANVSHDLRTPLASIQGYLDTLAIKNEVLTSEQRLKYLNIALNQAKSLSQLINTLFYLAKLDSGQIELEPESFRIDEVVQDVLQKFALHAEKKNIRFVAPEPDKRLFVRADLGLIERALSNLIDNALRHTPNDGSVEIRLDPIDQRVWLSVIDSGCGIPAPDLPHVFERYYRGDATHTGTVVNAGIGLSIVNRIVALHGERVEVSNAPERGAIFRFSLSRASHSDGALPYRN